VTPREQLDAVITYARAIGCVVRGVDHAAGAVELSCPDVQRKVDLLNGIAAVSAEDPYVAATALHLRQAWPNDAELAIHLAAWVAEAVRWIDEPGERFQLAGVTLRSRTGDCDCSAVVVVALLLALGLEAEVRGYVDAHGEGIHACGAVKLDGRWYHCEATNRNVSFGDDPARLLERGTIQ